MYFIPCRSVVLSVETPSYINGKNSIQLLLTCKTFTRSLYTYLSLFFGSSFVSLFAVVCSIGASFAGFFFSALSQAQRHSAIMQNKIFFMSSSYSKTAYISNSHHHYNAIYANDVVALDCEVGELLAILLLHAEVSAVGRE